MLEPSLTERPLPQMYPGIPGQRPQSQGYGGPRPGTAGRNEQVNEQAYGPG